jgi:hypothetical protein
MPLVQCRRMPRGCAFSWRGGGGWPRGTPPALGITPESPGGRPESKTCFSPLPSWDSTHLNPLNGEDNRRFGVPNSFPEPRRFRATDLFLTDELHAETTTAICRHPTPSPRSMDAFVERMFNWLQSLGIDHQPSEEISSKLNAEGDNTKQVEIITHYTRRSIHTQEFRVCMN